MQLAEEDRIGLDDPVGNYAEGVPGGDVMTIRQFAQMHAVRNYTESFRRRTHRRQRELVEAS